MKKQAGTELWQNGKKFWLLSTVTMSKIGPYFNSKEEAVDYGIKMGRWNESIRDRLMKEDVDGNGDPESLKESSNKDRIIAEVMGRVAQKDSPIAGDKKTLGLVIDYLQYRHNNEVKDAVKVRDRLKKELGRKFDSILTYYGNPDTDGFLDVHNKWMREYKMAQKTGPFNRPYYRDRLEAGNIFPSGAKVLIDGKDLAIIRQAFPRGSTYYHFPHYRVDIVDGDDNVVVAMDKVSVK